ncbi:MAG: heavy metal translocating P-type ATPase [Pseudoxanthomonas sp.]
MNIEASATACFHCAEPLPPTPLRQTVDGVGRAFCCHGCATAAEWIRSNDLDGYYRLRSTAAQKVGDETLDLTDWDRTELIEEQSRPIPGGREIVVLTDAMRCAACAWLIDRALARAPGTLDSTANAVTGRIRIAWDPARTALSPLLQRLAMLGYRPYLAGGEAHERGRHRERRRWLLRLGVAGLGALQAMMLAEALYLDTSNQMPAPTRDFFRWLTFLLSTPVVFYSGWPFLQGAWNELCRGRPGMDALIAGSTLLAYFASLIETIRGGVHVWYDAAVMFVFLLLAARMLEQRARNVANAQVDALARARPVFAVREREDGSRESVPVSALRVGDVVRIAAGDNAPADGVLLDGEAAFEEALLTGESRPAAKSPGDAVYAGTLCRERPARLRVTGIGQSTRLSQLVALVERAQSHRPPVARAADRIGTHFVAALLVIACATWFHWHQTQPERAFEVALAVLVISCPCALSLSVPAALACVHGALAKIGMLATRPESLDALAKATDIVFDKTGTLSDGKPALDGVETFGGFDPTPARAIAAALERDSGHPLRAAFAPFDTGLHAEAITTHPGRGIDGKVAGQHYRLGRADFALVRHPRDSGNDEQDTGLWLSTLQHPIAHFHLHEHPRPDAAQALHALRRQNLHIHLSSGDADAPVQALAKALCIDAPRARQSPQDKLATVRELQTRGRIVAMVGDGLNDAPVLAGADVSIAMGAGAPLAQSAADLVTTGGGLWRIPAAIELARRTRRVIRQNLGWALAYNLLALPLAVSGHATPWIAALGMAASSLLVTANALRLTRVRIGAASAP